MANRLEMAKIHSIQTLHARGWSQRRIARVLGVDRETVARYIRAAATAGGQNQPNPPAGSVGDCDPPAGSGTSHDPPIGSAGVAQHPPGGSEGHHDPPWDGCRSDLSTDPSPPASSDQNQPNPPAGSSGSGAVSASGPASRCEPFRARIQRGLEEGLSAQRIWQDLRVEQGFEGGYDAVKRFCRRLQQGRPLPFRRMECAPGEEAQVDFGRGAAVLRQDGKRRRPHVLRIVLSHSRKGYSEVVDHQTTDNFIRCLENAFAHFGGVPKTLVIDNLKAAVIKADWFEPQLNPKLQAFMHEVFTPTRSAAFTVHARSAPGPHLRRRCRTTQVLPPTSGGTSFAGSPRPPSLSFFPSQRRRENLPMNDALRTALTRLRLSGLTRLRNRNGKEQALAEPAACESDKK